VTAKATSHHCSRSKKATNIDAFLQAANKIQFEDPNVARICKHLILSFFLGLVMMVVVLWNVDEVIMRSSAITNSWAINIHAHICIVIH
jgi:hypothetical protein